MTARQIKTLIKTGILTQKEINDLVNNLRESEGLKRLDGVNFYEDYAIGAKKNPSKEKK